MFNGNGFLFILFIILVETKLHFIHSHIFSSVFLEIIIPASYHLFGFHGKFKLEWDISLLFIIFLSVVFI